MKTRKKTTMKTRLRTVVKKRNEREWQEQQGEEK